jgi:biotin carboxylase
MILGAGPFQLPAIQRAAAMGLRVVTVDYLPENIGHRTAHASVNCSTTDRAGVLAAARELGIDGIATFCSDVAVATVGHVADALGLPGISETAADVMTHKGQFRSAMRAAGLPTPQACFGANYAEVAPAVAALRFPVMVKPCDASGSRGVVRIDTLDPVQLAAAFDAALAFSRGGQACVEECVPGTEVGGDAFLVDGKVAFIVLTHKRLSRFLVSGHSLPTHIDAAAQARVVAAVEACAHALGYADGPLNVDVMVCEDAAVVLEMSARNGGNGIPELIRYATGVDLFDAVIRQALGETVRFSPYPTLRPCGSLVFGSPQAGRLEHVASADAVQAACPEVFSVFASYRPGDDVPAFTHNGNMLGYVLFDCAQHPYEAIAPRVLQALALRVVPTDDEREVPCQASS